MTASPMWATVRRLLPLAVLVNLVLVALERSFGSSVSDGYTLVAGVAVSVAAGSVARSHGCRWTQAVSAAWWLGACGAALNWITASVGLRPSQSLAPIPLPPGVSPFINAADPNSMAMVFNITILVLIVFGAASLLLVTPFALLGYWAYGKRVRVTREDLRELPLQRRDAGGGLKGLLDWVATFVVAFDGGLLVLFKFGALDPQANILPPVHQYFANGQPHADGLTEALVFVLALLAMGLLFWPAILWLTIRLVFRLLRGVYT